MAKRGRKPKNANTNDINTLSGYFSTEQEEAVVRYLKSSSDEEKNQIYNDLLKKPLEKMTESIINRYKSLMC